MDSGVSGGWWKPPVTGTRSHYFRSDSPVSACGRQYAYVGLVTTREPETTVCGKCARVGEVNDSLKDLKSPILLCLGCRDKENTTRARCKRCQRPCHTRCICICERPLPVDAPVAATRESLRRSVTKVPSEIPRPEPRGPVCESLCAGCPFRPDGSGYAADHPDFANIKQSVEMGLPFYCHETVLFDPRTKLTIGSNGDVDATGVQAHFLGCRGAHEHRMKTWEERTLAYFAGRAKDDKTATSPKIEADNE